MGLRKKTDPGKKAEISHNPEAGHQYQGPQHFHVGDDVELDAIERLKSNILMLDDLQQRLGFMNNELESVIGTRKKS